MSFKIFFLFMLFIAPSALYGQENTFKIKNYPYSFTLQNIENKCVLNYTKGKISKQITLDIVSDCKVIRWGKSDEIKKYYYKDIKATVIMIGGGLHQGNCKEETASATQAILISRNSVKLGTKRQGACLPDGPDEKEYWMSSH